MRRTLVTALALAIVGLGPSGAAGAGAATDPPPQVATILTNAGSFRAVILDPAMVARAQAELAGGPEAGIPIGRLAWGHGGVNYGHRWHLVELGFADFTIELCDGTARMVDQDPLYWVETVGSFCPWSGSVVALEPYRPRHPGRGR